MDKTSLVSKKVNSAGNLAVDGLIYGLVSGGAMSLSLAALALLTGETLGAILEDFSSSGLTSPVQGLLSHLAVSAIYGMLFGVLIWPVLLRFSSAKMIGLLGGLVYAILLLLLAQIVILPATDSPLAQLPFWQWALGHGVYGLVLGRLFTRKLA
jgi:hypothetical protein